MTINVTVNGESLALDGAGDLLSLLENMSANPDRVAVMLNDSILKRDNWQETSLADGDRLEILTFAGGG
jgi:sulfur carrier protein